jgi:hypothetical protein
MEEGRLWQRTFNRINRLASSKTWTNLNMANNLWQAGGASIILHTDYTYAAMAISCTSTVTGLRHKWTNDIEFMFYHC